LKSIHQQCKANGVLCILDEVISGFRIGSIGGMAEKLNIQPDLVCYGKILGGGFPVGCYAGRAELMNFIAPVGPVYQAGTLSANPVGMVAGLTTLKKIKRDNVIAQVEEKTMYLSKSLNEHFTKQSNGLCCTHFGSLFWIHQSTEKPIRAVSDIPSRQSERFKDLFIKSLDRGIYLAPNAYEVGFLSLAHRKQDLDFTAEVFKQIT
jgi:glutamate-1-semialdehyde 2,1-aminomutase